MADFPDNTPAAVPPRPGDEIAPQLERVLQNLNVSLEDELARYRRQRHGRVPPPPPPRRTNQRQTIDLISVPASPTGEAPAERPQPPAPPPAPPNPFLNQMPDADDRLLETEQSALSGSTDEPAAPPEETVSTEESLPIPAADTSPDGYLESSEELLKSIAEEETDAAAVPEPYSPERKNNSLLKLAGLVLVLLAGIGVGFAITYPSQLQNLRSQLWPNENSPEAASEDLPEATVTPSEPAANPDAADRYEPPGPDLSTREFVELDLESLSTLDVDGTGANGSTLPNPLPNNPAQSPLPQPAATDQQPSAVTQPANTASVPADTAPTPAAPAPAESAPVGGSNFYVVSSYTGDDSLAKARELVPDAFVRNFKAGARIQLAAFDNKAQAEDQVAFLTQQGATVELFGPTTE